MYKLKGSGDITNILTTVLQNREITDIEKFFNPSIEDELSYRHLKNMDKGTELLQEFMNGESRVLIVTDRDADGFTSSAILHSYIAKHFPEVDLSNIHHPRRENGLTKHIMATIKKLHSEKPINLVILPDSSSNDKEQHEELNSLGIKVLVLDHHEVTNNITESTDTVVINPQLSPDYTNKQIAGVGVTYKFLQALDDIYGFKSADDNLDLVAFGNITDGMDLREPDVRSIVYRGLNDIKNEFLWELIYKTKHYERDLSIHALSWDVLPKLNALIRVGDLESLQFVYEAMLGYTGTFENTRARTAKNRIETWAKKASRLCVNATAQQKRIKTKVVEQIQEFIEENNLQDNKMLIIPLPEIDSKADGLLGYIAGDLTRIYQKPIALMLYDEKTDSYKGSLRGVDSIMEDTGKFLSDSNLCMYVAGHAQAAGVGVKSENIEALNQYIEDNLKVREYVEVDFIVDYNDIDNSLFQAVDELEKHWCKGVEPPVFAIQNFAMPMEDFDHGENVSKVFDKGNLITTFSLSDNVAQYVGENLELVVDIIGSVGINRFQRNINNQLLVDNFILKDIQEGTPYKSFAFE